ncbi:hypothetical protein OSB04_031868 [Centaurea solstitialis]|uniref:DUF4283 domain-containing protein n=1 Tax=Centaurea solstitialis TaxID=347529 RepID=A0AA38W556_9ASTR|nr:hypothetical protein OSB04_031868 [Centaurea solstitialis]
MESPTERLRWRKTSLNPIQITKRDPKTTIINPINSSSISQNDDGVDNLYMLANGEEEPLSPNSRLFHEPTFNVYVVAVMGTKNPINPRVFYEKLPHTLLKHHRFSSLQLIAVELHLKNNFCVLAGKFAGAANSGCRIADRWTINDVALAMTQAGLSRYLDRKYGREEEGATSTEKKNNLPKRKIRLRTALVVNIRPSSGIQALADMMEHDTKAKWGNWFGYVLLPFNIGIKDDPLDYVREAKATVDRKKHSLEALYSSYMIKLVLKLFGIKDHTKSKAGHTVGLNMDIQGTLDYFQTALTKSAFSERSAWNLNLQHLASSFLSNKIFTNTTLIFSNMTGPIEEIGFYGHAIEYIAPCCYGQPQLWLNLREWCIRYAINAYGSKRYPRPHWAQTNPRQFWAEARLLKHAARGRNPRTTRMRPLRLELSRSGFSGRRRWIVAGFGGEGRLDLLFLPMVADQPPDPPVTRNRARKINAIKGTESSSLPASLPATTAAVPACGGTLDDRLAEGCTLVPQTNTIAAALSPDPPSPPLSAAPASSPVTTASPAVSSPPLVAAAEASAAPSGWFASRTSPATAGLSSPTMATTIIVARPSISPTGTTGVIGDDVGPFQQLLRDVSGIQGFHQQSSMLSTADADNEHNLSDGKEPNAGSFVDSEGKVYLHADETDVAHKPVSFADLLKKSANLMCGKGKLTYYPPVVTELGTRRAIIPDDLVQKQANEWVLTLAGYFIGKRPAFPFVQYHARRMWKKYGLTDVILNDQGYFFFKFNSDQGLNFVFENGPWLFNGMPIFIQRWQPGLCFDKPDLQTVPLWVNIYGLPLDVWDYEIISRIASVVGEPVSVDRYTDEMCETKSGRANFARVLVNVLADYELPSYIDAIILGKLRKFKTEFLWKPKRCSHCKVFGHDFEGCVIRPRTTDEVKKVNHVVGESSTPKDDGFNFPKRKKKPKPTVDPLKVGPKVVGIKINQRYVPKVILPTNDPLDKGKTKLNNDIPSPKAPIFKTERTPMPVKVSNQFTVLEEHPKWTADKKEVDYYVEKRGVGLEPVIINSWSRQKLDYFIDRWERVFGKELDGKLRGFTLPDRIDVGDDDDDVTSDDDVLSDHDTLMDTRPKKVSWSDRQVSTKMEQDMQ